MHLACKFQFVAICTKINLFNLNVKHMFHRIQYHLCENVRNDLSIFFCCIIIPFRRNGWPHTKGMRENNSSEHMEFPWIKHTFFFSLESFLEKRKALHGIWIELQVNNMPFLYCHTHFSLHMYLCTPVIRNSNSSSCTHKEFFECNFKNSSFSSIKMLVFPAHHIFNRRSLFLFWFTCLSCLLKLLEYYLMNSNSMVKRHIVSIQRRCIFFYLILKQM